MRKPTTYRLPLSNGWNIRFRGRTIEDKYKVSIKVDHDDLVFYDKYTFMNTDISLIRRRGSDILSSILNDVITGEEQDAVHKSFNRLLSIVSGR